MLVTGILVALLVVVVAALAFILTCIVQAKTKLKHQLDALQAKVETVVGEAEEELEDDEDLGDMGDEE